MYCTGTALFKGEDVLRQRTARGFMVKNARGFRVKREQNFAVEHARFTGRWE